MKLLMHEARHERHHDDKAQKYKQAEPPFERLMRPSSANIQLQKL